MTEPTTFELTGRLAVVTGASAGIGRAIARDLAAAGMRVVAAARRLDRLHELATESELIRPVVCDMRDEESIIAMFRALDQPVWALVNNAGLGLDAPLMSGETERWREMLDVNVIGLCVATREAIARMDGGGHVIHVSSMSGHRVPPGEGGMYAATKFAVRALTDGLRAELKEAGSPVRLSSISPGIVETEFAAVYRGGDEAAAREFYARLQPLESADIAASVRHILAAPEHIEIHDLLVRPRDQKT